MFLEGTILACLTLRDQKTPITRRFACSTLHSLWSLVVPAGRTVQLVDILPKAGVMAQDDKLQTISHCTVAQLGPQGIHPGKLVPGIEARRHVFEQHEARDASKCRKHAAVPTVLAVPSVLAAVAFLERADPMIDCVG